jgi:hypothetical protein
MLDSAAEVRTGAGKFRIEAPAEKALRSEIPDALSGRPGRSLVPGGPRNRRYLDIIDPIAKKGYEVKFGFRKQPDREMGQVQKDASMVNTQANPDIEVIQWDFFSDLDELFGPDDLLLKELIDNGIPYVIHLA